MTALPYPPPFQDLRTLAAHICASEHTIENWVKMGLLPTPKRVGGKRLWEWKKVQQHLAGADSPASSSTDDLAKRITDATRAATGKQD